MFTPQPIGFVNSPYKDTAVIPKGFGAKHEAEGTLRILPKIELGLTDIEGFSHPTVIWAFDRSHGFDLLGTASSTKSRCAIRGCQRESQPAGIVSGCRRLRSNSRLFEVTILPVVQHLSVTQGLSRFDAIVSERDSLTGRSRMKRTRRPHDLK